MTLTLWATTAWSSSAIRARSSSTARCASWACSRSSRSARSARALVSVRRPRTARPSSSGTAMKKSVVTYSRAPVLPGIRAVESMRQPAEAIPETTSRRPDTCAPREYASTMSEMNDASATSSRPPTTRSSPTTAQERGALQTTMSLRRRKKSAPTSRRRAGRVASRREPCTCERAERSTASPSAPAMSASPTRGSSARRRAGRAFRRVMARSMEGRAVAVVLLTADAGSSLRMTPPPPRAAEDQPPGRRQGRSGPRVCRP